MATIDDLNRITLEYMRPKVKQYLEWLSKHAGHDPRECDECMASICWANSWIDEGDLDEN